MRCCKLLILLGTVFLACLNGRAEAAAGSAREFHILYLKQLMPSRALLSNIVDTPEDLGLAGAELAITDNNTTGKFLHQHFQLESIADTSPAVLLEAAADWQRQRSGLIIADLPTDTLLALDQQLNGQPHILFNISNRSDELRVKLCRPGLLHTTPSRAMLADALAQYLSAKRWQRWFLIRGGSEADHNFADALQRAGSRFGGKFTAQKDWSFNTDLRRSAQQEIRLFTQAGDYDITLVADEAGDFGEYVPYNTWLARPVAGTQGLTPTGWHWSIEQWGAAQLQNRFRKQTSRTMQDKDYSAWLAVRSIGEAITRGASATESIYRHLLAPDFELAGFMGRSLSYRSWNGQLRQPIPLVQPNALISLSPQEGFLHPTNDLDTLGYDRLEVHCNFAEGKTS